jgi:WD40 repeat protein
VPILKYHENVIGLKTLALSPDNAYIYTGLEDNSIKVWKREGGQKPANITNAHNLPVEAIACTGDNNYVLSTSGENSIKVWAIAKWPFPLRLYDEIKIEKTDEFIGLGVLTDHKHIVAGSLDGGLKMLNIKTRVCKFNNEDESRLIKLLVTNINQIITCHANKTIKFWDLKGNL